MGKTVYVRQLLTVPLLKVTRAFSFNDHHRQKLSRFPKAIQRVQELLTGDWTQRFAQMLYEELVIVLQKLYEYHKLMGEPLLWLTGKVFPTLWVRPMANLLHWATRVFSTPPHGAVLRLESRGWREGRRHNLTVQLYHPDLHLFTAAVAAGVLQYLRGEGRKVWLWFAGHLYDPHVALQDMQAMGIRVQQQQSPIRGACPFCQR